MTETAPAAPRRGWWARWRSVVLVASLALNLLVLGIVTAGAIRHRFWPHPVSAHATLAGFARQLPAARRTELWKATGAERAALRPFRHELRGLRAAVRAALAAEPFDAGRFQLAQEQLMLGELRARRAAYALHAAIAMRLTREERLAFSDWQPRSERRTRWRGRLPADEGSDEAEAPEKGVPPSTMPGAPPPQIKP